MKSCTVPYWWILSSFLVPEFWWQNLEAINSIFFFKIFLSIFQTHGLIICIAIGYSLFISISVLLLPFIPMVHLMFLFLYVCIFVYIRFFKLFLGLTALFWLSHMYQGSLSVFCASWTDTKYSSPILPFKWKPCFLKFEVFFKVYFLLILFNIVYKFP